jgi:inner membrane protein
MASIGHIAVGLAAARVLLRPEREALQSTGQRRRLRTGWRAAQGMERRSGRQPGASTERLVWAMTALAALSLLPDADVVGFSLGIPYGAPWGHRGATHSLLVAVVLGGLAGLLARRVGLPRARTALVVGAVVASHGLLDALTDGGRGAALLWPFSHARLFAPVRPLPVAPIGLGMLSPRGMAVVVVELLAFLPCWLYALWPRRTRRTA